MPQGRPIRFGKQIEELFARLWPHKIMIRELRYESPRRRYGYVYPVVADPEVVSRREKSKRAKIREAAEWSLKYANDLEETP